MSGIPTSNVLKNAIGLPCPWCNITMAMSGPYVPTRDHIYPRSSGGDSKRKNILIVCHECNNDKGSKTLVAWLQHLELNGDARARRVRRFMKNNGFSFGPGGFTLATEMRAW